MQKLYALPCIIFSLSLSGCADTRSFEEFSHAENEQLDALHADIVDCAYANLPKIDDGYSPAEKIAISVSLQCEQEYRAAYQFVANNMGLSDKKSIEFMADAETTETKLKTYLSIVRRFREEVAY